jgi:hypothetical protein
MVQTTHIKETNMQTIILTYDLLQDGQSSNGGWSNKQLRKIGVTTPLISGWYQRLIGKKVNIESYKEFLALKNAHVKKGYKKKKHKTSTLLPKAIAFILENFSDERDGEFNCAFRECSGLCKKCDVYCNFTEIMEEFNK